MFAVDIAPTFVKLAAEISKNIGYAVASALELPFGDGAIDFATAVMSLMDIPEHSAALSGIGACHTAGRFSSVFDPAPMLLDAAAALIAEA